MIIDLHETRFRTVEQVRAILEGTEALEFVVPTDTYARCAWISLVLGRLRYRQMKQAKRASRGHLKKVHGRPGFARISIHDG
ncbi:hypothetical protein [Burkholderia pyrrocinia]|uniref:Transposase n=1 Tax=Burkholderia pyrrocinia TaxID=60550 RepID=A0ABZ3BP50_BURPY